jgi:hypothetical protein
MADVSRRVAGPDQLAEIVDAVGDRLDVICTEALPVAPMS